MSQHPKPPEYHCRHPHCPSHKHNIPVCNPWHSHPFSGDICPICGHWAMCHADYADHVEDEECKGK